MLNKRLDTLSKASPSRGVAIFRRIAGPMFRRTGLVAVLEVPGRRTGAPRYATIFPIEVNRVRYLVSQYGDSDWVRNLRSAESATLHRKGRTETIMAREVDGAERDAVLAAYGAKMPGPEGRDYRARPTAADHPTFRVESIG